MAGGRKEHELLMKLTAALGSNFNSTFQSAMNTTNQLQGHIKSLQSAQGDISAYRKAEDAIRDLREEKARLESAGEGNEAAIDRVNRQLAVQEDRLSKVSGRLQEAGVDTNNLTAESERLKAEQERLVKSQEDLARATKAVEQNNRALKDTKRELLVTMGKITIAAAAIWKGAIEPAAQFQSSMSDIQAQTGMSYEDITQLGYAMREMGRNGRHGGQEIAEAYAQIALRGQDVAHSTELMRTSIVLADAVGGDLTRTAYFLGNYLNKVGKDTSYAERYINVFAHTVQGTGIELATLQDYLFRANASLQLAGISGTQATAIFGNLYQAGIRGANAYSGFQQAIQSLMLPSDGAAQALERLGINVQVMKAAGYDMTEIMFQVGDALEYVECNTERLALMQELFTQQTAFAFADELFNQRDVLRDLIPELYEVGDAVHGMGVAYEIAASRNNNLQAQMAQARNTINDVRISIGTALLPAINELASGFAEGAGRVAEWAKENQDLILTVTKVAAGLAAAKVAYLALKMVVLKVKGVILAIKAAKAGYAAAQAAMNAKTKVSIALSEKELKTTSAVVGATIARGKALITATAAKVRKNVAALAGNKALIAEKAGLVASKVALVAKTGAAKAATVAQWLLNKAMLANPIGLIIAAIAAVIAIVVLLIKNWDAVKEAAARLWEKVKEVFTRIWEFIKGVWESIKAAFAAAWAFIKSVFSAAGEFFAGVWSSITGVFSNVVGWFSQKFTQAWEAIKAVFSAVGAFFQGVWDTIVGIFGRVGTAVGEAIGGAFRAVVNSVIGFAERIINGFIGSINRAIGVINRLPGVNIPVIGTVGLPQLEKGSNFTPKNFIAGDVDGKGGEIVANARGRKVFTAAQTSEIFQNIKAAKALLGATPPPVSNSDTNRPPTMMERVGGLIGALRAVAANRTEEMAAQPPPAFQGTQSGGRSFTIEYSPTIYVSGDVPGDLEEKLKKNNEHLLQMFKEFLRQQREDEGRMTYA